MHTLTYAYLPFYCHTLLSVPKPHHLYLRYFLGPVAKFLSCRCSPQKTVVHTWTLVGKTMFLCSPFFRAVVSHAWNGCLGVPAVPILSNCDRESVWCCDPPFTIPARVQKLWAQLDLSRWKKKPWGWKLQSKWRVLIGKQSSEQVSLLGRN